METMQLSTDVVPAAAGTNPMGASASGGAAGGTSVECQMPLYAGACNNYAQSETATLAARRQTC